MLDFRSAAWFAMSAVVVQAVLAKPSSAAPTLAGGYSATVFASPPSGSSQPDSIVVNGSDVWIAYGNGIAADGSGDNLNSQIVHYGSNGSVLGTFNVPGHNDGLKIDPATHLVWAVQNEDGSPNLRVINPATSTVTQYALTSINGGGYDDLAFTGGKAFISASSPAFTGSVNTLPVIGQITLGAGTATVTPILHGDTTATDIRTGGTVTPNVTDPDSMTVSPTGDLVLDDQSGNQLIFVSNPGQANQSVRRLSLANPAGAPVNVDDTGFAPAGQVGLLATERATGQTYLITGPFGAGNGFSADPTNGIVGSLGAADGTLTPIFTDGSSSVRGLAFVSVPEPASIGLLAVAGAMLSLSRRRTRA